MGKYVDGFVTGVEHFFTGIFVSEETRGKMHPTHLPKPKPPTHDPIAPEAKPTQSPNPTQPHTKPKPKPHRKPVPDETSCGGSRESGCKKCYCHRDFTVAEIKKIIGVHHLFSWKNCPLPKNEKNYERLTEELNKTMKKYKITSCLQKAHFLSQCAHESANFQTTVEGYGYKASYAPYYGRGLIQLTHGLSNYKKYSNFKGIDFVKNPNLIANKLNLTCDVSGWYWRFGSVWDDLNIYADKDDCLRISLGVNGGMNGYNDRKMKVKKYIRTMQIQTKCKNLHLTKPLGIYKYTTSDAKNKSWARKHRNMLEKYDD